MIALLHILLSAWIVLGACGWEWGVVSSRLLAGPLVWALWMLGYALLFLAFIIVAIFFPPNDHEITE
jgi:hypothetical protein